MTGTSGAAMMTGAWMPPFSLATASTKPSNMEGRIKAVVVSWPLRRSIQGAQTSNRTAVPTAAIEAPLMGDA